ncbi:thiamine pyrophosphate-dependent dehydrogenase E1 component subunit alpha [Candidatus Uhrbacteria bacterium]|nr:thiamine pyrophosphate-dependent dehydrogenase E1 component subunit alpha [Candidatus Uhrbacteria bacterium]
MHSKDFLLTLYRTMFLIRTCEESFVPGIHSGEIRCPVHLSSGQEAIAAGVCAALEKNDMIFGTHRSHGHYLAKGGDLNALVAEIYGKEKGCSRGRGGSMHVLITDKGYLASVPIVAGTISLAVGAALAAKIRKDKTIAVSFFGDGAAGEGVLYEAMNFASLKKLPILFVCENNYYSTHMPIRECRPDDTVHTISTPFGIPSFSIDGNDVVGVYETAKNLSETIRNGGCPAFLECRTYRFRGHVGPDDNIQGSHQDIRPQEEIDEWKTRDPIPRLAEYLKETFSINEGEFAQIHSAIENQVTQAHQFAKASPYPDPLELTRYVFRK